MIKVQKRESPSANRSAAIIRKYYILRGTKQYWKMGFPMVGIRRMPEAKSLLLLKINTIIYRLILFNMQSKYLGFKMYLLCSMFSFARGFAIGVQPLAGALVSK